VGSGTRRGFSLAETLVALVLGILLTTLALRSLAGMRTVAERLERRGEELDALRTARHVLARELRMGPRFVVASAPAADTLAVRALRGVALICPGSVRGRDVTVVPDGIRTPDPAKDSVWLLGSAGEVRLMAIETTGPREACPALAQGAGLRWTLSGDPPPAPSVALYFERGSYHLSGGALRYRRGEAGRQPLTPEVLGTPPSRFEAWHGSVAARLDAPDSPRDVRAVVPFVAPGGGDGH